MALEAIAALAEFAAAAANLAFELTVAAVRLAWTPLRFAVSPRFREAARERWREEPRRRTRELIGGSVALLFFAAVLAGWIWLFTLVGAKPSAPPPPPAPRAAKPHRSLLEKLRALREKHR